MRKKVLFVLDGVYPMDVRVQKEISALNDIVDVHLVCAKNSLNTKDYIPNFYFGPSVGKLSKGIREILISTIGIDPLMRRKLKSLLAENQFDLVHVHDLPQFKTVFKLTSKKGIPLILDLHENYPEAIETWFQWRKSKIVRLKNLVFFNVKRWRMKERYAVKNATEVIAVVEEMKQKLKSEFSLTSSKITVVNNSGDNDFFDKYEECHLPFRKGAFNILYTGGIGPHRGLDDVIRALGELNNNVLFHIYGSGHRDNISYLKDLANSFGVMNQVIFHNSVPLNCVPFLMTNAELNIIPHKSNGHCNNTVPHKLFHGLLTGKPLMVSSSAPLLRITQNGKYAANFDAGDYMSCAKSLNHVILNYEDYRIRASEAKTVFAQHEMSWSFQAEKLKSLYSEYI